MINQKVQQYNAAVYLRLSKEDMDSAQKAESNSIVNQKQLILGFLQDKPDIKVVSIRIDDGYTGTNFDRPQFQLMLDDIKAGLINCVVVKEGFILGVGAKIFQIAGPVILYGVSASVVYGILYWIVTLF